MKKINQICIWVTSCFLMAGCNDNNDSSHTTVDNNAVNSDTWTSFKITEIESSTGNLDGDWTDHDNRTISVTRSTLNFKDKQVYELSKYINPLPHYKKEFIYSNLNGVYGSDTKNSPYGSRLGKLQYIDKEKWVLAPNLIIGNGIYERTYHYKVLDIAGQKVFFTLDPYTAVQFNGIPFFDPIYDAEATELYKKLSEAVFPAGSKCIQIQLIEHDQDTLTLTNYLEPTTTDQDDWQSSWGNLSTAVSGVEKIEFKDTQAYVSALTKTGVAKLNNKFYGAKLNAKGELYSLANEIAQAKAFIDSYGAGDPTVDAFSEQLVNSANQSCNYFDGNTTKVINGLIGLYE